MKNFMCIAITKKIMNKEVFSDKETAYLYFQQKFETDHYDNQTEPKLKTTETAPGYHVWGTTISEIMLFQEPEMNFLRICGIYSLSGKYAVIEEQYSFILEKLKTDKQIENIYQDLPKRFQTKKEALYIIPESNEVKKAVKFIRKMKTQILREHKKLIIKYSGTN